MRREKMLPSLVALAILGTLGSACEGVERQMAEVRKPVRLTLFVFPADVVGDCAVVTIPQYVYAKKDDDIVWDVSNETCKQAGEVTIEIDSSVVEITEKKDKEKKGKVKGDPDVYKYKVKLASGFVEDPRIEIW